MDSSKPAKQHSFLNGVESLCNKLPQPAIIFMFLFVYIAVLSLILSLLHVSVVNPSDQQTIAVQNFFSVQGLYWFLDNMVTNFTSFPPLAGLLFLAAGKHPIAGMICGYAASQAGFAAMLGIPAGPGITIFMPAG
jgi:aminobenzoyl-glutamate transport protein